jgi:hypothetical protein
MTTHVSQLSQLSLTLRYVHDSSIREDKNDYQSDEEDWKEARKLLSAEET